MRKLSGESPSITLSQFIEAANIVADCKVEGEISEKVKEAHLTVRIFNQQNQKNFKKILKEKSNLSMKHHANMYHHIARKNLQCNA